MATAEAVSTLLAGEIVFDPGIYPRVAVNDFHVGVLLESLRGGVVFPPLLLEEGTNRIVDGAHRHKAYTRHGGPTTLVPVEWRVFPSEVALLLEAARRNTAHGLNLTQYERELFIQRVTPFSVDPLELATALAVGVDRLATLRAREKAADAEGHTLPPVPSSPSGHST
jgi:hypothetical protein